MSWILYWIAAVLAVAGAYKEGGSELALQWAAIVFACAAVFVFLGNNPA